VLEATANCSTSTYFDLYCWSGEMRERLLGEDKEAGKFKLKISEFK
jgi:hypothetical protein